MRLAMVVLLSATACNGAFETRDEEFAIPNDTASPRASGSPARPARPPSSTASPGFGTAPDRRVSTRRYEKVRAGDGYTCAIDAAKSATCWGRTSPRPQWAVDELAVRDATVCALASGSLRCWGDTEGWLPPPVRAFHALGIGYRFACAFDAESGRVHCWGPGASTPPDEPFASLAVGWSHACGLRADGTLACWGDPNALRDAPPEGARFRQLALGGLTSCALDEDGAATCWGPFAKDAPARRFSQLSAGNGIVCGVRADTRELACWGNDVRSLILTVPAGTFEEVSVGSDHACAVSRTTSEVVCWGADEHGQATPP